MKNNPFKPPFVLTCLVILVSLASACAANEPAAPSLPPTGTAAQTAPPTASPPTEAPPPSPTSQPVLGAEALKNMTYLLDVVSGALPDSQGKVALVDGAFEQPLPGSAGRVIVNHIKEARGDLNGDGLEDAVALLAINTGGTGTFINLAAVLNEAGNPRQAAIRFLGDRVEVQSLAIEDGVVKVKAITQGPEDPLCCPTLEVNEEYRLQGGRLVSREEGEVLPLAERAIRALEAKDMVALAELVHPAAGLRFSPYSFVRPEDQVFSPDQLSSLITDTTTHNWGNYDGSGEPIELSFADYFDRFVYSKDFASAPQVSLDQRLGMGNTIDNSRDFYPEAVVVEYHIPGENPDYGGMDWQSLRLVFQQQDGAWYLAGIIHDEWTI
jgi:hypothetical protein